MRALAANTFWSLTGYVLTRGSLVLAAIVLSRYFDAKIFASYAYFQLTISMLATYAAMGLGISASKFFAEHVHRTDTDNISQLVGTLWIVAVLFSVAASAAIFALPREWINAGFDIPTFLIAGGVLVLCLQVVPSGAIMGLEEFRRSALIAAVCATTTSFGAIYAILKKDVNIAMYTLLASSLIQMLGESYVVLSRVGLSQIVSALPLKWRRIVCIFDVSAPMAAIGLVAASGSWIVGRILLAGPGHQKSFALFSIGLQWFALSMFVPGVLARVFLPRMVKQRLQNPLGEDGRAFTRKAIMASIAASLVVGTMGIILGPFIVKMYGQEFRPSSWFIAVYIGAATLSAPVATLGNAMLANGKQWVRLQLMIVWILVLVVITYLLRAEEIWAAPTSYAISYAILSISMYLFAMKEKIV